MKRAQLQKIANQVCNQFYMSKLSIEFSDKLTWRYGDYDGTNNRIRIGSGANRFFHNVDTLLHELAHHLHHYRFENKIPGFYKMEIWPAMVLDHIDESGQKWYAAKGEKKPVYFITGTHDKVFRRCLNEIREYYKQNKRRQHD